MDIIDDYGSRKARAVDMSEYVNTQRDPKKRPDIEKVFTNLKHCASYLVFHEYLSIDQIRLVKAHTCKQHLLCPFCAMRRSGKYVAKNIPKLEHILSENPSLIPVMITYTVKNGPNLRERYTHLKNAERRLKRSALNYKNGQKWTEYARVQGAISAYEFTKKEKGDWHPHIHMFALVDSYIDQQALSQEWLKITGDSFIVDIRKIKVKPNAGGLDIASGLLEVCKYALKFHDMTLPDTWIAYNVLRGKRLVNPSGLLRGVELPDNLLDDPLEGVPYIARHYRYTHGKRAYDLTEIRNHDAL